MKATPEEAPRASRARRVAARLALVLGAVLVALVVVELAVRALDPFGVSYYRDTNRYFNEAIVLVPDVQPESRIFDHRPELALRFPSFELRTDARGLRTGPTAAPDPPAAGDGSALRLLFLGDSVTLAWGVDDRESWPRRLEREEHAADGRPLVCLNGGHLQYNSLQEADWLAAHGAALAPDVVVLTFVTNDLDDAYTVYLELMSALAASREAEPGVVESVTARLRTWFRGLGLLWHFQAERREAVPIELRNVRSIEEAPGYAEGWARCETGLSRVLATCRELGARLVVLDHSTPPVPALRAWCAEHGVPVHDFTFDDEEWRRDIRNSLADSHANALGNELLAAKACRALVAEGVLAPHEDAR